MSTPRVDRVVLNLELSDGEWVGQANAVVDGLEYREIAEVHGGDFGPIKTLEALTEDVRNWLESLS